MTELRIRIQAANCQWIQRIRIRAHSTANLHEENKTYRGIFLVFFPLMYVIQPRFICRPSDPQSSRILGSNPGLLRLWQSQPDAITTWLDLIYEKNKNKNLRHVALYKRLLNQVKGGAIHILHKWMQDINKRNCRTRFQELINNYQCQRQFWIALFSFENADARGSHKYLEWKLQIQLWILSTLGRYSTVNIWYRTGRKYLVPYRVPAGYLHEKVNYQLLVLHRSVLFKLLPSLFSSSLASNK